MNFQNTLWQEKKWETFQKKCENETFRIGDTLIIVRRTFGGRVFFEIPRKNIAKCSSNFWKELEEEAQKESAVFTRVFPADKILPLKEGDKRGCKSINPPDLPFQGRRKGVPEVFPEHTLFLNLSQPFQELLSDMKQKGRYNIRLAEKKGVHVYESTNIDTFYNLLKQTTERDGFSAHSKQVYQTLLETFHHDALLLVAEYNKEVISAGIFLFSGDTATYYYGASSNIHRNVMAPYLLQWKAIQEAQKRGCGWYDFLGIAPKNNPQHGLAGVSSFKEKFGGIRHVYAPAFEVVHDKKWYFFLKVAQKLKKLFRSSK